VGKRKGNGPPNSISHAPKKGGGEDPIESEFTGPTDAKRGAKNFLEKKGGGGGKKVNETIWGKGKKKPLF